MEWNKTNTFAIPIVATQYINSPAVFGRAVRFAFCYFAQFSLRISRFAIISLGILSPKFSA